MKDIQTAQSIYCIGIGGIGVSALARLLHSEEKQVSGSDMNVSELTKQLQEEGIVVSYTQDGSALPTETDLVIFSDAVPEDHPERQKAKETGITQISYFQAVGEYAQQFDTVIAVAGTHGKSTTTAMLANILVEAGKNPTAIVGSLVTEFDRTNYRKGGKELFIVEACEHQAHFLHIVPDIVVITNVEADHLDYYSGIDHIVETFQQFIDQMPETATVILNGDDEYTMQLTSGNRNTISFGFAQGTGIHARDLEIKEQAQSFIVDDTIFVLDIPGDFNVSNALGAITVARELEVDDDIIRESIASFNGVWRRFEVLGLYRKAIIVSDYAHHPTEIRKTIHAARGFYPDCRIVVAFQPHQRERTQALFQEFVEALATADLLILQEIFDVAGREDEENTINAQTLIDAIEETGQFPIYSPNAEVTIDTIDDVLEKNDVVLIMGAGDIYKIAKEFEVDTSK